jgi:hypothetical protein
MVEIFVAQYAGQGDAMFYSAFGDGFYAVLIVAAITALLVIADLL